MNEKLSAIQTQAGMAFRALWLDAEEEIAVAIARAVEDAQAAETECVFTVGFQIALDFGKDKQRHKLTFGKPRKYESEASMPNPAQRDLKFDDASEEAYEGGEAQSPTLAVDSDGDPIRSGLLKAVRKFTETMEESGGTPKAIGYRAIDDEDHAKSRE